MNVFVTGASGFVGSHLLPALTAAGHSARCLVRKPDGALSSRFGVVEVAGDILKPDGLVRAMDGCDAVIHLVGIIEEKSSRGITFERIHDEGTHRVVEAAGVLAISRFVHMSANGARSDGVSGYQTSKWNAENRVRSGQFDHWTIFRPSTIFGDPGDDHPEFCSQLANSLIRPFPVLPVFGDGLYRMQPVSVKDVAMAFVQALTLDRANGKTYCVGGPDSFSYTEILDIIARGLGDEPKAKIHQPVWLVRAAVNTLGRWGLLPITPDQFEMLLDGNTCDASGFEADFNVPRIRFSPENLAYLKG